MSTQFYIRLQHGISGGFAPPNPTSVQTLTSSLADGVPSVLLQTTTREATHRRITDAPTKDTPLPMTKSDVKEIDELVVELEKILKDLPTEQPPGSADIYGMDIGLMYGSDKVEWANGGPQGCGGGNSEVTATDEQREQFKRAVEIVEKLAALGKVETS